MFTRIIQLLRRKNKKEIFLAAFFVLLLSVYPIYKNFYNGAAVTTYERHIALIKGESEYFNPWQYRMLCPLIIEGLMYVYNHTIDKIYPVEEKFNFQYNQTSEPNPETKQFLELLQTKGALKYLIVFILFRLFLNMLVFTLAYLLWRRFVHNRLLILFGLMFVSLAMGNAVIASDLTFNTYLDNVFYLIAACIIVYRYHYLWFLPLTILAALNRETAMLIPLLFFVSQTDFSAVKFNLSLIKSIQFPPTRIWLFTFFLLLLFIGIFISVRMYYGYVPPQVWKASPGAEMIKLNLISPVALKSYMELLGVMAVIPFVILYCFYRFPVILKVWFLTVVPLWFAVHIYSVVIYQTRLFMVPLILILLPMMLWLIESYYRKKDFAAA
jgi:hypothetical protein